MQYSELLTLAHVLKVPGPGAEGAWESHRLPGYSIEKKDLADCQNKEDLLRLFDERQDRKRQAKSAALYPELDADGRQQPYLEPRQAGDNTTTWSLEDEIVLRTSLGPSSDLLRRFLDTTAPPDNTGIALLSEKMTFVEEAQGGEMASGETNVFRANCKLLLLKMKITENEITRSELIGRITQSAEWPEHDTVKNLSLSSFDEQDGDEDDEAWVDVSWFSFTFLLDLFSCMACGVEAFTDLYFIVLQFDRPNGGGTTTAWVALGITIWSTLMFLAPPGKGGLSMFVKSDKWPYDKAQEWVYENAQTANGNHLRTQADWKAWLETPAGRHRPVGLLSDPDLEYCKRASIVGSCDCPGSGRRHRRPSELGPQEAEPEPEMDNDLERKSMLQRTNQHAHPHRRSQRLQVDGNDSGSFTTWENFLKSNSLIESSGNDYTESGVALTSEGSSVMDDAEKAMAVIKDQVTHAPVLGIIVRRGVKEDEGSEPGWLCGEAPATKWDEDNWKMVYGRTPAWLMYLLTVLQVRVLVEGMISWRNVRTLKSRHERTWYGGWSTKVRVRDLQRARLNLDTALLREGIFETLPQAVLEFQNLWADE